jgi:putative flippase GtrA
MTEPDQLPKRLSEAVRFGVWGLLNTALTYALYCGLLFLWPAQVAYLASYLVGTALAYWGNSRWVFARGASIQSAALYPLLQLTQYALTAVLLEVLRRYFLLGDRLALLIAIAVIVPIAFFANRMFFSRTRDSTR